MDRTPILTGLHFEVDCYQFLMAGKTIGRNGYEYRNTIMEIQYIRCIMINLE